ncbi:NAD(P)/FAD-dependent oxidoreductase [Halioxenophilus sp. WMMB6]|uniref:NAD(P)/FAD-dependent oxidoreductase n=1 Tax=Halioxenophilus sp. WMMB6 TaxID=3073815 RepID=UPI00295F0842|nr:NAD(P)/FAD-dependent oxidoreductase [Halioxenophilus sp. WMMB6]
MNSMPNKSIAIIGGGFTGLTAALKLSELGYKVQVFEADDQLGGLAGSFTVGGEQLEKFYHHWFTNDAYVTDLIRELGKEGNILYRPTETGSYYANKIFRLSSPLDLLKYTPISLYARLRMGLLVLIAKTVRNWQSLENISAYDWIRKMAGNEVLEKVWQPLLIGKFGKFSEDVSAVWFWNKLVLRGGSRDSSGKEILAYYRGGFSALAEAIRQKVEENGGKIHLNTPIHGLTVYGNRATAVQSPTQSFEVDTVLCTTPLPIFAQIIEPHVTSEYLARLRRIKYLGNVCLTLELNRSLSKTYWLNISDPNFPFVGIIEHTNFEPKENYANRHIVYLSKYLPTDDPLYKMDKGQMFEYAIPHIKAMFPDFDSSWVLATHLYKAEHSQPIVEKNYSTLIPDHRTPVNNVYLASMAQIYPEDRGTNYAIREGAKIAHFIGSQN